ncbi:transglutaminase-like domain-containing protein [Catenulispora rubra]|uniref:transglutaminase-like domain-containing protein n=1 Tax=Catenulispora rubra TaxID=280293 RepID=UPI001892198A|nr:transglutaminase-like domain-containing protein [Catenulispora rubra]
MTLSPPQSLSWSRIRTDAGPATDAVSSALLAGLALAGFHTSYDGWSFLVAGLAGLAFGLLAVPAVTRFTHSAFVLATVLTVGYFLVGNHFVAPDQSLGGYIPTGPSLRTTALAGVESWKQLLTTVSPADGAGSLVAPPFILGLLTGAITLSLARRTTSAAAPAAAPTSELGVVIAFGSHVTALATVVIVVFAGVALGWAAQRRSRTRGSATTRTRGTRMVAGISLLAVSGSVVVVIGPGLPGADDRSRAVLRDTVSPPFDISDYPSPLVGFRKYTKDSHQLWDQTLFTVSGLSQGVPVRIATLDSYDGSVWGASNGAGGGVFQRVGSQVAPTAPGSTLTTVSVTVGPAYAAAADTDVWLPGAGTVSDIGFAGGDADRLASSVRYNLATSSAIVPGRLHAGDTVVYRTAVDSAPAPSAPQPFDSPPVDSVSESVIGSRSSVWTKAGTDVWSQLQAAATYLKDTGAYSDGGPGETQFLPGHSINRLSAFLHGARPVGDSEQYAAAFALIAQSVGMPARVVLGAVPEADGPGQGKVFGRDVQAWVEVHIAGGRWVPLYDRSFMPDPSKKPDTQTPQDVQNTTTAAVPPPRTVKPHDVAADPGAGAVAVGVAPRSCTSAAAAADPACRTARAGSWWPSLKTAALACSPLLAVLAVVMVIAGLKARRRFRRRTRGAPANRMAAGWQEVLDRARDLGLILIGTTRREQASSLARLADITLAAVGSDPAHALARAVDTAVYGAGDPTEQQIARFWLQVAELCDALRERSSRRRRLLAAVSISTLYAFGAAGRSSTR